MRRVDVPGSRRDLAGRRRLRAPGAQVTTAAQPSLPHESLGRTADRGSAGQHRARLPDRRAATPDRASGPHYAAVSVIDDFELELEPPSSTSDVASSLRRSRASYVFVTGPAAAHRRKRRVPGLPMPRLAHIERRSVRMYRVAPSDTGLEPHGS